MFNKIILNRLKTLELYLKNAGLDEEAGSVASQMTDLDRLRIGDIEISKDSEYSDSKDAVRHIQQYLISAGLSLPRFGVDGEFGEETHDAVIQFQESLVPRAIVNGIVDSSLLLLLEGAVERPQSPSEGVNLALTEQVSEGQEVIQDGETLYIDRHAIYPFRRDSSVDLVVFYHGTGYGTQDFVLGKIKSLMMGSTMFLIPKGAHTNFSEVTGAIDSLVNDYGVTINSKKLGAWSGGSVGFMTASGSGFDEELLADPSPERKAFGIGVGRVPNGVYMEYNPDNWSGNWSPKRKLRKLAEKVEEAGGTAVLHDADHNEILTSILELIS